MNRNLESHFSVNPVDIDIQRSRFDRDFNHKFTGNVGEIIPWFIDEVLPGDTFDMTTSKVIRFTSFLKPVMDNLYLDTYFFFVPMRLVWDHAKEFFGENTQSAWYPTTEYTIPQVTFSATGSNVGSIADYMGACPPGQGPISVSALPIRAYYKVYEDWFRSEAIQDPLNIYTGDANQSYGSLMVGISSGDPKDKFGYGCLLANKYFDYFTSALPSAQRGPAVTFDLIDSATVSIPEQTLQVYGATSLHGMSNSLRFGTSDSNMIMQALEFTNSDGEGTTWSNKMIGTTPQASSGIAPAASPINKNNLVVTVPASGAIPITGVNALSVNELRMAFQLQKWYEKSALYGGRYVSMLKGQYGVTSPDATLQRTEYLGGNRVPIQITQVENTAAGDSTPLGELGAYSATSDVHSDFIKSFTEHGFVLGVSVVRYRHTLSQGVERFWSRKHMTDFYFPVFANLGNQPIFNKELYVSGDITLDEGVFGYQEAYGDYRYKPDRISGEMRPGISNSLASWHFGDYYTDTPSLSPEWLAEDKTPVDRTLAVTSAVSNQYFADFYCDLKTTRPMPMYSIPGLIDHH